jgi:hypothetical protein
MYKQGMGSVVGNPPPPTMKSMMGRQQICATLSFVIHHRQCPCFSREVEPMLNNSPGESEEVFAQLPRAG